MPSSSSGRILAAVLFTDIVNSTSVAEELGDRGWKLHSSSGELFTGEKVQSRM